MLIYLSVELHLCGDCDSPDQMYRTDNVKKAVWEPENTEFTSNENTASYRIVFTFFFVRCGICLCHMKLFRLLFFNVVVYILVIWKMRLDWYYLH